jgi:demethylmenaquinone methyltransferase/2-methoxy-6-polyprenyl-1,4-benzoquinol methylase
VRSGGRVIVLEFGQPRSRRMSALYEWYRSRILPRVGGAVTGRREAYEYLEQSAAAFPCGDAFADLMRASASFASVEYRPLSFGIAYLYKGVKR